MDDAHRRLSDDLDTATQRLLDEARLLSGADLRAPSLLPGWSRAHVLAHLARGADANRNLLAGARRGQDRPGYASPEVRAAGVEAGVAAEAQDLVDDVANAAMALRAVVRQLPAAAWDYQVRSAGPDRFPARGLLVRRLAEVELHHCDLGVGYGCEQWMASFRSMDLPEPWHSQRAERRGFTQPESMRARSMARKVPPYQPSRPMPGSWIGRQRP